jgi:hypothetical protein
MSAKLLGVQSVLQILPLFPPKYLSFHDYLALGTNPGWAFNSMRKLKSAVEAIGAGKICPIVYDCNQRYQSATYICHTAVKQAVWL